MGNFACAHPGKMGDALYSLPAIRELCRRHASRADFYTSSYCAPLRRLFEAQGCIDRFVVAEDYVLQDFDCGARPWQVPVPAGYDAVYQMGFENVPRVPLPDYIAHRARVQTGLPIRYDFDLPAPDIDRPYIVSAPRGYNAHSAMFRELADCCPITVVEIGVPGEGTGSPRAVDRTGLDMLEVLPWLAAARGFVGLHSSMLVLANGFPIVKVGVGGGDRRHAVASRYNQYLLNPSAEEVFRSLGVAMTFCKTLDPSDYELIHETQHAENIKSIVGTFGGRAEHRHRAWEYGLVLRALRGHGCKTVLDVGGGGSVFAPAAAWVDMRVTEVDATDYGGWVAEQARKIRKQIAFEHRDFMSYDGAENFDAVTCISVLEHVPNDQAFYRKLASHVRVGGLLAITVDFWPDARRKSPDHLRTYNAERLSALARSVPGLETLGPLDYAHRGKHVYDYTFASMVCRRVA